MENLWIEHVLFLAKELNIYTAVLIFFGYALVDGLYAYYTFKVVERDEYRAAFSGAFMHFILAFGVLSYVQNYLYVVPLALGSFLGTFILVRREKNKRVPL
jgi:hypothetical protein